MSNTYSRILLREIDLNLLYAAQDVVVHWLRDRGDMVRSMGVTAILVAHTREVSISGERLEHMVLFSSIFTKCHPLRIVEHCKRI